MSKIMVKFNKKGFTLLELVIVMALTTIVLAVITGLTLSLSSVISNDYSSSFRECTECEKLFASYINEYDSNEYSYVFEENKMAVVDGDNNEISSVTFSNNKFTFTKGADTYNYTTEFITKVAYKNNDKMYVIEFTYATDKTYSFILLKRS